MRNIGISFLYAIWHSPLVRSQLTLDDVDFTVLIATSVLTDLIEKCPPAEACRDAFVRMSKATISMCEKTTGFGSTSTLSSQQLNSPDEYFSSRGSMQQSASETAQLKPAKRKMTMPKFDMNLKELFSEEEIANRPLTHQPKLQGFRQQAAHSSPSSYDSPSLSTSHQSISYPFETQTSPPPSITLQTQQANLSFGISNQQPYVPFAETISQTHPDFSFDDMSFLDTFPVSDPNPGSWGGWSGGMNDLDLGFGTGGTGSYDSNGNWDLNGVDMFGGFFFGGDGNASGF